jgi:hypothetical protein
MALQYSPKIVQDSLVMCLDASQNKSYPTTDLPVKGGLALWLDAADDSTFSYSSGTSVSQWRDKSGNNFHATQALSANQPSRSTTQNSRKTVNFDGTNDTVTIPNFVCNSEISIFVVSNCGTTLLIEHSTDTNSNQGFYFYGGGNGMIYITRSTGSIISNTNWLSGGYSIASAVNSTGLDLLTYKNGTQQTIITDGRSSLTNSFVTNTLYIGSRGANSLWSSGPIAEIIIYNRKVSNAERNLIHTYLGQKWGISNTDRSIIDLSGFNDNGLLGDGTTANMPVYDYYNKGAFRFDGSNDFIKVGPNSSLQVNNVTIAAFFKTVNNGQSVQFIAGYGDTGIAGYWIGTSGGAIRFSIGGGSGNYLQQSSGVTPNNDQIYYVVGTYDGTNQRVYVNGVLQASATTVTGNISYTGLTDGFLVGQVQGFTAGRYLTGSVYNVSVYSRALSQAEISQNYEALKSKFTDAIVQQGLVLNIDAANPYSYGGAGTTVYDTSNTALSWTATNVTYNSDPIKYFSFNGSNSSLVSSTSTAYDSQTITMECWCYPNSLNQLGFLFEKGAVNSQYSMFFSTTNTFYFRTIGGTINNQDLTFTTTTYLTVSAWNHIVCTYNGSSKVIYVNGTQIASVAASGTLQTGQTNQYIGKYGNAGDNYPFNGRIAESRVYNIALTAAQVLQNYNATRTKYGL